jgi:hypothetical protein
MPILDSILDHKVLGREYKRQFELGFAEGRLEAEREGELACELKVLRRMTERRFGPMDWSVPHLANLSAAELKQFLVAKDPIASFEAWLGCRIKGPI